MTHLLCFDPGNTTGWAWFTNGELSRAASQSFDELIQSPPRPTGMTTEHVVIECPHGRPRERDVNALIKLAVMVGRLQQFYRGHRVDLVWPQTWKGSVPKKVHNKRVLAALMLEERARLPARPRAKDVDHNLLDAVGLGLWKLGRMR